MIVFNMRKIHPETGLLSLIRYFASEAVCKKQLQRPVCLCHATLPSRTLLEVFMAAHDLPMNLSLLYSHLSSSTVRETCGGSHRPELSLTLVLLRPKASLKAQFLLTIFVAALIEGVAGSWLAVLYTARKRFRCRSWCRSPLCHLLIYVIWNLFLKCSQPQFPHLQ